MDDVNSKQLFGKLLGELFRIQNHLEIVKHDPAQVQGLCDGIERVVDDTIETLGWVGKDVEKEFSNRIWKLNSTPNPSVKSYDDHVRPVLRELKLTERDALVMVRNWLHDHGGLHEVAVDFLEHTYLPPIWDRLRDEYSFTGSKVLKKVNLSDYESAT